MNTFSKFDQLGAVLSELSFDVIQLQFMRHSTGRDKFIVYLHPDVGGNYCVSGDGATAGEALADALKRHAEKQAAKVEAAAERGIAA